MKGISVAYSTSYFIEGVEKGGKVGEGGIACVQARRSAGTRNSSSWYSAVSAASSRHTHTRHVSYLVKAALITRSFVLLCSARWLSALQPRVKLAADIQQRSILQCIGVQQLRPSVHWLWLISLQALYTTQLVNHTSV